VFVDGDESVAAAMLLAIPCSVMGN